MFDCQNCNRVKMAVIRDKGMKYIPREIYRISKRIRGLGRGYADERKSFEIGG